jgi:putative redox protein
MVEDFRKHDLRKIVENLRKALLVFHSPEDETVAFYHAIRNSGYDHASGAGYVPSTIPRSLVALPGSNHLLTNSERDIPMIVAIASAWCMRLI